MIKKKSNFKAITLRGSCVSVLVVCLISCTTVGPGQASVAMNLDGNIRQLDEGVWFTPCCNVDSFDLRQSSWSARFEAITADGMPVYTSEAIVTYRLNDRELISLDREIGPDYENILISPIIQSSVRQILAKYRWDQFDASGLQNSQKEITALAKQRLARYHIILDKIEIRNILSELKKFNEEVIATSVTEQLALESRIKVKIAKDKAAERIQEAKGMKAEFSTLEPTLNKQVLAEARNSAWERLLISPSAKVEFNNDNETIMEEILP